ncbi:hypothetical protein C8R46DRAFT_1197418 [Mycena filopes]|nr:hypothetical protein C8R46DRAFT_1197418 [Mycena filopes]
MPRAQGPCIGSFDRDAGGGFQRRLAAMIQKIDVRRYSHGSGGRRGLHNGRFPCAVPVATAGVHEGRVNRVMREKLRLGSNSVQCHSPGSERPGSGSGEGISHERLLLRQKFGEPEARVTCEVDQIAAVTGNRRAPDGRWPVSRVVRRCREARSGEEIRDEYSTSGSELVRTKFSTRQQRGFRLFSGTTGIRTALGVDGQKKRDESKPSVGYNGRGLDPQELQSPSASHIQGQKKNTLGIRPESRRIGGLGADEVVVEKKERRVAENRYRLQKLEENRPTVCGSTGPASITPPGQRSSLLAGTLCTMRAPGEYSLFDLFDSRWIRSICAAFPFFCASALRIQLFVLAFGPGKRIVQGSVYRCCQGGVREITYVSGTFYRFPLTQQGAFAAPGLAVSAHGCGKHVVTERNCPWPRQEDCHWPFRTAAVHATGPVRQSAAGAQHPHYGTPGCGTDPFMRRNALCDLWRSLTRLWDYKGRQLGNCKSIEAVEHPPVINTLAMDQPLVTGRTCLYARGRRTPTGTIWTNGVFTNVSDLTQNGTCKLLPDFGISQIVLPRLGSEPPPNLNRTRTGPQVRFEVRRFWVFAEPVRTGTSADDFTIAEVGWRPYHQCTEPRIYVCTPTQGELCVIMDGFMLRRAAQQRGTPVHSLRPQLSPEDRHLHLVHLASLSEAFHGTLDEKLDQLRAIEELEMIEDEQVGHELVGDELMGDELVGDELVGDELVGDEVVEDELFEDPVLLRKMISYYIDLGVRAFSWEYLGLLVGEPTFHIICGVSLDCYASDVSGSANDEDSEVDGWNGAVQRQWGKNRVEPLKEAEEWEMEKEGRRSQWEYCWEEWRDVATGNAGVHVGMRFWAAQKSGTVGDRPLRDSQYASLRPPSDNSGVGHAADGDNIDCWEGINNSRRIGA